MRKSKKVDQEWLGNTNFQSNRTLKRINFSSVSVMLHSKSSKDSSLHFFQMFHISHNETAPQMTPEPHLANPLLQHTNNSITFCGITHCTPQKTENQNTTPQQTNNEAVAGGQLSPHFSLSILDLFLIKISSDQETGSVV